MYVTTIAGKISGDNNNGFKRESLGGKCYNFENIPIETLLKLVLLSISNVISRFYYHTHPNVTGGCQ